MTVYLCTVSQSLEPQREVPEPLVSRSNWLTQVHIDKWLKQRCTRICIHERLLTHCISQIFFIK